MKYFLLFILILFVFTFSGCSVQANSQAEPITSELVQAPKIAQTQTTPEEPQQLDDYFVKEDSLAFNGYEVVKLSKTVKFDYPPEMKSEPESVEVSYAVLKKKNKILKTFDGVYFGVAGNATEFGMFPFLGKESKQLAVSQTIPRSGRHWIVDLSAEARVVFDSQDYGVGREEFSVIDLDKDGVFEILFPVTAFYLLDNSSMAEVPMPTAVFKYDESAKKYLPANRQFPDYLLNGIGDRIKNSQKNKTGSLSDKLEIVLSYIYAGKEKEAWKIFDNEYDSPDKAKIKAKVKSILKDEKIYQSISKTVS
jgi:hypothetical protein